MTVLIDTTRLVSSVSASLAEIVHEVVPSFLTCLSEIPLNVAYTLSKERINQVRKCITVTDR